MIAPHSSGHLVSTRGRSVQMIIIDGANHQFNRVERGGGDKPRVPRLLSVFDVLTESDKSDSSDECESDHSNC